MDKKIKVSGYTKKNYHLGDITYRPFNPIAKPLRPDAVFTSGNFSIISNVEGFNFKNYIPGTFSKYYSLSDLGFTNTEIKEIYEKDRLTLNFDRSNLKNYAYFGSLKEYMRVTLEKIIMSFPAGIIIMPYIIENDVIIHPTTFNSDTGFIEFDLKQIQNPYSIKIDSSEPDPDIQLRDFTTNYESYTLSNETTELKINSYEIINGKIKFNVGKYGELLTQGKLYLKPNEKEIEKFFNSLNELGKELLNRDISPKYTYNFNKRVFVPEVGYYVLGNVSGTWPTSDGYNLDFNNSYYYEYIENLIELCDEHDLEESNIIIRQLISTTISEFDTVPSYDNDNIFSEGQKIKTLLSIYGRSFDETKKYIDNLKNANIVTYDGKDNTPDYVVSSIANTLGWNFKNINEFATDSNFYEKVFTRNSELPYNYTKEVAKKEVFKRLIINSPWLYKAKGTRKSIDFFTRFLNIPKGLLDFKEYVYVAKNKLDYNKVSDLYNSFNTEYMSTDNVLVDKNGYPVINKNTENDYFQMAGRWYRETTGLNAPFEINDGNNPHIGPYDNGTSYLKKFTNLIPNFQPSTYITTSNSVKTTILFNENFSSYQLGPISNLSNTISQERYNINGNIELITPPKRIFNNCGCETDSTEKILNIGAKSSNYTFACNYNIFNLGDDSIYRFYMDTTEVPPTTECCEGIGGTIQYSYKFNKNVCTNKTLVECERYVYKSTDSSGIQIFTDRSTNTDTSIVPTAECCSGNAEAIPSGNGFKCSVGESISGKCIKIDSIEISHSLNPRPDFIFKYIKASTNRSTTNRFQTISNGVNQTDIILRSNPGDKFILGLEGNTQGTFTVQDLINNSGSTVASFNNHRSIVSTVTGLTAINYSYVNCPSLTYDDICIKFISATFEGIQTNTAPATRLGLTFTSSVDKIRSNFDMGFTGDSLSIEDNLNVLSVFDVPLDITLTTISGINNYTLDLKTVLDYSTLTVGSNHTIVVTFTSGAKVNFKIEVINCVSCPYLDPVSEVVYNSKKYTNFLLTSNQTYTTEVPSPECCPSYTFPEVYGNQYRCFTGEYEINNSCSEQDSLVYQMSGDFGTVPPKSSAPEILMYEMLRFTNIDGVIIRDNQTFVAETTGRYKFDYSGYGVAVFNDSITGQSDNRRLHFQIRINGDYTSDTLMRFEWYNNTNSTSGNSAPLQTFYLDLTAGDKVKFTYNKTFEDGTFERIQFKDDCYFNVSTTKLICGCPTTLEMTVSNYNPINNETTYVQEHSTATIIIKNGSDVKTYTIDLTSRSNNTFSGFNIKSDTEIIFNNYGQIDTGGYYGSEANGVFTCTGLEVMTSIQKIIRVFYKGTGNVQTIRDFYFNNNCTDIPKPAYRVIPAVENYLYQSTTKWLDRSYLTFNFEVREAIEIYIHGSSFCNPSPGSTLNFYTSSGIQLYLIENDVVSTTPLEYNILNLRDDSVTNCYKPDQDINRNEFIVKAVMPVGTWTVSLNGSPGDTYCSSNHNLALLQCGLNRDDINVNFQTSSNITFEIVKGVGLTETLYNKFMSSVDYCQTV